MALILPPGRFAEPGRCAQESLRKASKSQNHRSDQICIFPSPICFLEIRWCAHLGLRTHELLLIFISHREKQNVTKR